MNEKEKELFLSSLLTLCKPNKVILHGTKHGLSSGQLKSASICIVVPACDKPALLRKLYLELPLDFQVNINLYTIDEWNRLSVDPDSYAGWINKKGTVIYAP